jgi:tetratricopeptide (TPR) repeat protein
MRCAHDCLVFTGDPHGIRDMAAGAAAGGSWHATGDSGADPERAAAVVAMHAFGLEETGRFVEAETAAQRARAWDPANLWAVHALAHVCEETSRIEQGIELLESSKPLWGPTSHAASHVHWHLALYYIAVGNVARALEIYDTDLPAAEGAIVPHMIDATSLLWRVQLAATVVPDLSARWLSLCDAWETRRASIAASINTWNDVHLAMAAAGAAATAQAAGQTARVAAMRLLVNETATALSAAAAGAEPRASAASSDGRASWRCVTAVQIGVPLSRALDAYADARFDDVVALLAPLRSRLASIGGSNAQRDIFELTLLHAALQSASDETRRRGRAILQARVALRPNDRVASRMLAAAEATAAAASAAASATTTGLY